MMIVTSRDLLLITSVTNRIGCQGAVNSYVENRYILESS